MTGPREGLPPCVSMATFEGRVATFHDQSGEPRLLSPERFVVSWGTPAWWGKDPWGVHVDIPPMPLGGQFEKLLTDDPDEAQAAFERGREYVRTGQLGEVT